MKKTRHGTSNFKALIPFVEVADANGGYAKFTADGFMDLVLEKLYYTDYEGNPVYSIAHYGIQNGDLMADPEVTFSISRTDGNMNPLTFRNDYLGIYQEIFKTRDGKNLYSPSRLKDNDEFLYFWRCNLADQGFTPEVYRAEP